MQQVSKRFHFQKDKDGKETDVIMEDAKSDNNEDKSKEVEESLKYFLHEYNVCHSNPGLLDMLQFSSIKSVYAHSKQ